MAPRTPSVKINVQGARGESQADILRRTGQYGVLPTDTDAQAMAKLNAVAIQAAATAESAAGPTYDSIADGLAATTDGQAFAADNGDGTVSIYLNDGGSAVFQRSLLTTQAAASDNGASLIGTSDGSTVQKDIDAIGVFKFLHSSPEYDVTADFQSMIDNAKEGSIINPYGDGILTGIEVSGKNGLIIEPKGKLKLTGDMEVDSSNNFELIGGFYGNKYITHEVTEINTTAKTIKLDEVDYLSSGADVLIFGSSPFPWFKARLTLGTSPSSKTYNYTLNTTIGGDDALIEEGDELRLADTTNKNVRGAITIKDSGYVNVNGYFERDVILHNCRHSNLYYSSRFGQPSLEFCSDIDLNINTEQSLFYGFGSFKTRRLSGKIKSLGASFGNTVIKNCYDSHFDSIYGEYGGIYGIQVRDDSGTDDPSTVNPDLQTTRLQSKGVSMGSAKLWRCGRGLFLDGITRDFSCPVVEVRETVGQGGSLMMTTDGAFDIDLPRVIIEDHGMMLDQVGYFRSNADIRLQQGTGVNIKGVIRNSLHTGYVFTNNATAGLCDRVNIDLELDNCKSGIDISGSGSDYEIKARGRNPASDDSISLINIIGNGKNIRITQSITETPTNGNKWQNNVRIFSTSSATFNGDVNMSNVQSRSGSVKNADVYIEPGNSTAGNKGEIHLTKSSLLGGGLYGVTARYVDKLYVYDNDNSGHSTADYHTSNFSASDYRIEGKEIDVSYTIDWPSIAAGAVSISTARAAPKFFSDSVVTAVQYRGNSNGIMFSSYLANSEQIYISAFNPTTSAVDLASGQMRVVYKSVYRPY